VIGDGADGAGGAGTTDTAPAGCTGDDTAGAFGACAGARNADGAGTVITGAGCATTGLAGALTVYVNDVCGAEGAADGETHEKLPQPCPALAPAPEGTLGLGAGAFFGRSRGGSPIFTS